MNITSTKYLLVIVIPILCNTIVFSQNPYVDNSTEEISYEGVYKNSKIKLSLGIDSNQAYGFISIDSKIDKVQSGNETYKSRGMYLYKPTNNLEIKFKSGACAYVSKYREETIKVKLKLADNSTKKLKIRKQDRELKDQEWES